MKMNTYICNESGITESLIMVYKSVLTGYVDNFSKNFWKYFYFKILD